MAKTQEEIAEILFELLGQDIKHKRLDIGVKSSSLETEGLSSKIELETDDSLIRLTITTFNIIRHKHE